MSICEALLLVQRAKKNKYDIVDETSVFYETEIVHTVGDSIINMHTDGARTHMWHNLFIADMEKALNTHDIEAWAEYAWDLESYMQEQQKN